MESQSKKGKRYSEAYKAQLVELYAAGRSAQELSEEFGCHVSSIVEWVKQRGGTGACKAGEASQPLSATERQELLELRRRVK